MVALASGQACGSAQRVSMLCSSISHGAEVHAWTGVPRELIRKLDLL